MSVPPHLVGGRIVAMTTNSVAKDEAVRRLRAAGFNREADLLDDWRDINENGWGWDGWIRGAFPDVAPIIWP